MAIKTKTFGVIYVITMILLFSKKSSLNLEEVEQLIGHLQVNALEF